MVGAHTHFGEYVTIITSSHNYREVECLPYDKVRIRKGVTIGECVWIGDRVMIVPRVKVGDGTILAAGTVVVKDVAPLRLSVEPLPCQ